MDSSETQSFWRQQSLRQEAHVPKPDGKCYSLSLQITCAEVHTLFAQQADTQYCFSCIRNSVTGKQVSAAFRHA